jgi:hypothetical protein
VSVDTSSGSSGESMELPLLGSTGNDLQTALTTRVNPDATLDVVISTGAYISCLEDESGDKRDEVKVIFYLIMYCYVIVNTNQVAMEVLDYLSGLGLPLRTSYSLPVIEGGYMNPKYVVGGVRKVLPVRTNTNLG